MTYRVLDLFSGIGGFSLGLKAAGIRATLLAALQAPQSQGGEANG